jgi:4-hydroxythreonine-4-phosphate dehydrogenase
MPAPLAVSLGDPAGVGPELICEAWARREEARLPPFFVCGGAVILGEAAAARGLEVAIEQATGATQARAVFARALPVLGGDDDGVYRPGEPRPDGARLAFASLSTATSLTVGGDAGGVVTGPISKILLAEVGFAFPGQTEFVADACGTVADAAVMMLAGPQLRTVPITVHCALSEVPARLTSELIVQRSRIVARALQRDFGISAPRLAVCGLNPHAGESGSMGREEIDVISPAIAARESTQPVRIRRIRCSLHARERPTTSPSPCITTRRWCR